MRIVLDDERLSELKKQLETRRISFEEEEDGAIRVSSKDFGNIQEWFDLYSPEMSALAPAEDLERWLDSMATRLERATSGTRWEIIPAAIREKSIPKKQVIELVDLAAEWGTIVDADIELVSMAILALMVRGNQIFIHEITEDGPQRMSLNESEFETVN